VVCVGYVGWGVVDFPLLSPPTGLLWWPLLSAGCWCLDFSVEIQVPSSWSFGFQSIVRFNRSFGLYRRGTERTITFPRKSSFFNRSEKIKPNDHNLKRSQQPPAVYGRRGRSPPSSDGAAVSDRSRRVNVRTKRSAERTTTRLPKPRLCGRFSISIVRTQKRKPND
jgi:hypothetical protein